MAGSHSSLFAFPTVFGFCSLFPFMTPLTIQIGLQIIGNGHGGRKPYIGAPGVSQGNLAKGRTYNAKGNSQQLPAYFPEIPGPDTDEKHPKVGTGMGKDMKLAQNMGPLEMTKCTIIFTPGKKNLAKGHLLFESRFQFSFHNAPPLALHRQQIAAV